MSTHTIRHAPLRFLLAAPRLAYHVGLGRLLDHRFLLLVHRGRRSGRRRETVLEVLRWDPVRQEAFVLAGFGRRSSWLRNVEAAPPLELRIGGDRFVPTTRVLGVEESAAELAQYERAHRLLRPVVRRVLSRLGKTPYDGSDAARRRVVERLPVVAFQARSETHA